MMKGMSRRVVITGIGTVNPLGNNLEETWQSVQNEKCGIAPITFYDTSNRKATLAAEVKNLSIEERIGKREMSKMDRFCQLAMIAAEEAVIDCGIDFLNMDTSRCGVRVSSGIGGLETIANEHAKGTNKGFDRISPFFIPMSITNMASGQIAIKYGLRGKTSCVVTACAGGADAIGESFQYIRDGYSDIMLCGGAEAAITELAMGGFTSLKALSLSKDPNRASIPFDKERNGFIMGEGAAILVLEELDHALSRNAKIYGEVIGYGANCDAYHITAPVEDGSGAANCMKIALEDAGITADKIDYINAHGTSTPMNDKCEILAIKRAFEDHAKNLMISSTKSMTGHLLGASGALEIMITTLALRDGFVPATINYSVPDEECDLDIVPNKGRRVDIKYAMSDSLGFGGHNAVVVLKKYEG